MVSSISFFKMCNENLTNPNEYNIARVIFSHIDDIRSLSLESIAYEANISIASVSRFINKAGYKSFSDFKHELESINKDVKTRRMLRHHQKYFTATDKEVTEIIYKDVIEHINSTKNKLKSEQFREIIELIKNSSSVTIIGDSHELADLFTLQIDLLINNIPTYFINVSEPNKFSVKNFNSKKDLVIYIDICSDWFEINRKDILKELKENNIKTIAFAQEEYPIKDYVDQLYLYGIENSVNSGYYSLPYISKILSELLYH